MRHRSKRNEAKPNCAMFRVDKVNPKEVLSETNGKKPSLARVKTEEASSMWLRDRVDMKKSIAIQSKADEEESVRAHFIMDVDKSKYPILRGKSVGSKWSNPKADSKLVKQLTPKTNGMESDWARDLDDKKLLTVIQSNSKVVESPQLIPKINGMKPGQLKLWRKRESSRCAKSKTNTNGSNRPNPKANKLEPP